MRRGLGRGLDNLIPSQGAGKPTESRAPAAPASSAPQPVSPPEPARPSQAAPLEMPTRDLLPNPYQPRKQVHPEALAELSASIREHGILQPLIARKTSEGFEVVAGWRRLKAAEAAGLATVPVLVRQYSDSETAQLALIENLQREDLNPVESAEAYRRLLEEFGFSQQELADAIGKARTTIANTLRLLQLPRAIRDLVEQGQLTEGHARALLQVDDLELQLIAAEQVVRKGLNVRQTESLARKLGQPAAEQSEPADPPAELMSLKRSLESALGTRIDISIKRQGSGAIQIYFPDSDELDRLIEALLRLGDDEYPL